MISDLLRSEAGRVVISIIIGLGLASMFRKVCKGNSCVVVKGPATSEVKNNFYKIDGECYRYSPYTTNCDGSNITGTSGPVPEPVAEDVYSEDV